MKTLIRTASAVAVAFGLLGGTATPQTLVSHTAVSSASTSQLSPFIGLTVAQVIDQLSGAIQDSINQLSDEGSILSNNVRTDLTMVLQNLEYYGSELVGKTFDELDQTQQSFFNDVAILVDEVNTDLEAALQRSEDLLVRLDSAFATLPLSRTFPRVLRFEPSYVSGSAESVEIVAHGSWIGSGSPTMQLGGEACERLGQIDTRLTFRCPLAAMDAEASGGLETRRADLVVEGQKRFFWSSRQRRDYELPVTLLPETAITLTPVWTIAGQVEERRSRNQSFGLRNEHCRSCRDRCWSVNADQGWRIDPQTIDARPDSVSSNSTLYGPRNITATGFCVSARICNRGTCGPGGYPRDARGSVRTTVYYTEFRMISGTEQVRGEPVTLGWGESLSLPVPEGASALVIEGVDYSGRNFAMNASGSNAVMTLRANLGDAPTVIVEASQSPG